MILKLALFVQKCVDMVLNDQDNDFTFVTKVFKLVAKDQNP